MGAPNWLSKMQRAINCFLSDWSESKLLLQFDGELSNSIVVKELQWTRRRPSCGRNKAFLVELSPHAFEDLDSISTYIEARAGLAIAERWFHGIFSTIRSLSEMSGRCPALKIQLNLVLKFTFYSLANEIAATRSTLRFSWTKGRLNRSKK